MNARDAALAQLDAIPLPHWKPRLFPRLNRPADPAVDPRDRALAEQIVVNVIKNLLRLQFLIEHHAGRNLRSIDPRLQKILAIGLCQMRLLDRIPASAAVDQAVDQAKRLVSVRSSGFVNAVLRNATRQPDPPPPDQKADPLLYMQIGLSFPAELANRLIASFGLDHALRIAEHANLHPPTIVRLNTGVKIDDLPDREHITITPYAKQGMIVIEPTRAALLALWARKGLAQAQDPTAAEVASVMPIQAGQVVLDRCCGMGTKTFQLLERVGPTGRVYAMDPSGERLAALRSLIEARKIENIFVVQGAMLDQVDDLPDRFDHILVDAPCSNSGVMARRPEARYAQTDHHLRSLNKLQRRILDDCVKRLAPNGSILYSTCSIWQEENQTVVESFLKRQPALQCSDERLTLPNSGDSPADYHDGGYRALLQAGSTPSLS